VKAPPFNSEGSHSGGQRLRSASPRDTRERRRHASSALLAPEPKRETVAVLCAALLGLVADMQLANITSGSCRVLVEPNPSLNRSGAQWGRLTNECQCGFGR